MKLNVPEVLKIQLVDDWEAVTKNNQVDFLTMSYALRPHTYLHCQLVTVPRNPTVVDVLHEFNDYVLALPKTKYVLYLLHVPPPLTISLPAYVTRLSSSPP